MQVDEPQQPPPHDQPQPQPQPQPQLLIPPPQPQQPPPPPQQPLPPPQQAPQQPQMPPPQPQQPPPPPQQPQMPPPPQPQQPLPTPQQPPQQPQMPPPQPQQPLPPPQQPPQQTHMPPPQPQQPPPPPQQPQMAPPQPQQPLLPPQQPPQPQQPLPLPQQPQMPPPQPQQPHPPPQQSPQQTHMPPPQPQQPLPPPQQTYMPPPQPQQPLPPPQQPPQQTYMPPPQPQQPPPPPQQPYMPPPQPQQPLLPPQQPPQPQQPLPLPQMPPPQPQQPPPPPQQPPQQPQMPPPQPQQPPPPPQQLYMPPPQPQQPLPPPQQPQMPPPQPQQPLPPQHPHPPPQQTQQPRHLPPPNLPNRALLQGPNRDDYLKFGVPLYEACIKCNWKAAKAILAGRPELLGYGITENGETPLHVAASAKGTDPKRVQEFVKKLVGMMTHDQMKLQNKNYNTALYLAAVAGNVETVKIMASEDTGLLTTPGAKQMMPLYAAALFGNTDVVEYIYEKSKILTEREGWSNNSRGWLIEKLVENNMFDTSLHIVTKYPIRDETTMSILKILARKPEAFNETKSNIMRIKSVLGFFGLRKSSQKKSNALPLLRYIWGGIVKRPTREIDTILRGPPDSNSNKRENKTVSEWAVKVMQLQKIIREHVQKMNIETGNIMSNGTMMFRAMKLQNLISESLVSMHVATQQIIKDHSNSTMQDNKPVTNKEHLALELQKLIFKHIADMHDKTVGILKSRLTDVQLTQQLQECIFEHTGKMERETDEEVKMYQKETHSSRVVFIAAEMGNTKFLVELIRGYPDLIWKVNDNNQSMFHIAVKHRHEGIYNLLYEMGAMKDLITPLRDKKENNMLHLVGKIAKQNRLDDVSGVALQMQLELLWFHEVKKMIPVSYRERENDDGYTPHDLFTKEHKDLLALGEKWMKGTASQSMVVAALIATIVFAATFTVPGGYKEKIGIPVFRSKAPFLVFVVADAISLILSSTSILMFLSILTSRYAENDFLKSLPRKLLMGLATLFLSITTMMVAFGVTFFVFYNKGLRWIPILICALVVIPIFLYIWSQYRLFFDVIRSTYRSRYLFKPLKRVLYHENPKF
ncbi:hypothetical protein SSX86_000438 [Deinandra increscens subsp. villosa]|uniref:PGG domain-containing protein n=1 Tax=Deinandra increscens subsp. villosa TaxID=3103831 RepID=A0AAP0DT52_9ASTR